MTAADRSPSLAVPADLVRELDAWRRAGMTARFWLRDDDAVSDTPELRRLLALAADAGTVFALAVIPETADESLVERVAAGPACIWQHGWAHHWHYEDGEQSYSQGEFGAGRDLEQMMADALKGQSRLDRLFGERGWQRVFVPPFHAFCLPFKVLLPSLGYRGLSAGDPLTPPVDTVAEVNADIDVINWRKRKFHGAEKIARMLVGQLQARRRGDVASDAPIGLLTHHLAMDEAAWRFLEDLFPFLAGHEAAEFLPADRLFAPPAGELRGAATSTQGEVTVVITSCGRQDLLERTLDSFLAHNTCPLKDLIVIEDGNGDVNLPLADKYRDHSITWLETGHRVGQVAAIDIAYESVTTDYIFHCEDDWKFLAPGFIEKSMVLLAHNPSILQVWLRGLADTNRHPVLDFTLTTGGIAHRLLRHDHDMGEWGVWHGFSWNPGLRRRRDYELLGSFGSLDPEGTRESWQVESDASAFYRQRGFVAAILADSKGTGYVRHLGRRRRVARDLDEPARGVALPSGAPGADRDNHARRLMARLAVYPKFDSVPQVCAAERQAGIDESPDWQIWTDRPTTGGQLRIEDHLETLVGPATSILHIGAGNSSLGRRFAGRAAKVLGTTLHEEEKALGDKLGIANYSVLRANKFSEDMDAIAGPYQVVVDPNPSTYACCLFHFSRMIVCYVELLDGNGGLFLTEKRGLKWVSTGNDPNWSFGWDDWVRIGEALQMPVSRATDAVYAMRKVSGSGLCVMEQRA